MPFTHATFLIGTLALVGIPPFAGFWSKDAILARRWPTTRRSAGRSSSAGCSARCSRGSTPSASTSRSSTASRRDALRHGARARSSTAKDRARCSSLSAVLARGLGVHRVPAFPGSGSRSRLARSGRRAARPADRRAGLADQRVRGGGGLVGILLAWRRSGRAASSSRTAPPARARAQVLLRRALRRRLLAAGAADRGQAPGPVRGAGRPGGLDEVADGTLRGASVTRAPRPASCGRMRSPSRSPSPSCARLPGGPLMLTTAPHRAPARGRDPRLAPAALA